MIRLYNVSKVYPNGVVALLNVTLRVEPGEFVFVMGPSGAGKSTLINLVMRQILPTQGQIVVDGRNVTRLRHSEVARLRRGIGTVFQDFKLLPNRTAYENVAFALEVVEAPRREIKRKVPAVLDLVGLAGRADLYPAELSGGEQQRVSIARAIVKSPAVLLADEPTGNLDMETSWGIMELLDRINKRGTTVVMATHNTRIVEEMKKRVIVMDAGRVVRDEPAGSPPESLLSYLNRGRPQGRTEDQA